MKERPWPAWAGFVRWPVRLALVALLAAGLAGPVAAQQKSRDIAGHVKVNVTAEKPDADGKRVLAVTLDIENDFHVYANPVGQEDLEGARLRVKVTAGGKDVPAEVAYPNGTVVKDEGIGDYKVYRG